VTPPLLACHALSAGYGKLTVVRDLELEAEAGSVTAVLGPNGAGKTTAIMAIAGLLARQGEVVVEGRALPSGGAAEANRAGAVLVPDDRSLFTALTVRENIVAAARKGRFSEREVHDLFPPLQARWNTKAGALSGGEQQMLAVARAIVQRPKVLLIDEMSMGLAPVTVEKLLPVVRTIADSTGAVVVIVEQHIQLALEVADRVIVLVHGHVALDGAAKDLAGDLSRLEAAYLGEAPASPVAR
jgi:branched-chain amino acid transport system ATP-binding protein